MKKNITQTAKIIVYSLILSAGIALAQNYTGPTASAPLNNIPTPINVGSISQSKTGPLIVGPLAVYGSSLLWGDVRIMGPYLSNQTSNLYVSGKIGIGTTAAPIASSEKIEVNGNVKARSLQHTTTPNTTANLCLDTNGVIIFCPVSVPPTPPSFSLSYQITSSTTLGGTGCSPHTYNFSVISSNATGSVSYTKTQTLTSAVPSSYDSSFNVYGTASNPSVTVDGYLIQTGTPTVNSKEVLNVTGTDQAGHVASTSIIINGFKAPKYASNGGLCPL